MQCQFIKTCTALSVVGMAGTAFAGGGERFDASFAAAEIFVAGGAAPANAQNLDTAGLGGRYYASFGHSNLDVDVCWNTGAAYSGWASEIQFVMEMEDGTTAGAGALFLLAPSPFAGDNTGSDVEGACSNRVAADELDTPLPGFTYQVANDGLVDVGITATFDDGTGLRHSTCNTANFYFTLGANIPAGCVDATGSCSVGNGTPGCEDLSCCATNCDANQGGDPFCCSSSWDSTCAETAIALCGIYIYSCDAPGSQSNDCATSPIMMSNGDSLAFNTVGANTDGPGEAACGSGENDLPVWSDLWYMVDVDVDANLTATCCLAGDFDTKIAIYDAGVTGTPFDPQNLPESLVVCNEDCDDPDFFTSEAIGAAVAGNSYLIRVGGYLTATGSGTLTVSWQEPDPPIAVQECSAGNPDSFSQVNPASGDFVAPNIVSCNGPTYSAQNGFARIYTAADMGADVFNVDCVKIPCLVTCTYTPAVIRMLKSASGAPAPYADLELIAENNIGVYQNGLDDAGAAYVPELQIANFGGVEVDLSDGSSLVIEIEFAGNTDCYTIPSGGVLADITDGVSTTYLRSSSCGITEYTSMAAVGGFDSEMFQFVEGTVGGGGGTPCPTDFNDDGITDGADFGTILASWGSCPAPCPADLDNNGEVNGADVGSILAAWGACP